MTCDSGSGPTGRDVKQARGEAPQSGHVVASPEPHRNPSSTPPPVTEEQFVARALARSHGLRDHRENIDPWMRDARTAIAAVDAARSQFEDRREWAERIADQFSVDDPAAINAIEEGLALGKILAARSNQEATPMDTPIEYRDERGDLIASSEPRVITPETLANDEQRALDRLTDPEVAPNELLLAAREMASNTTMMTRDSDAWLDGQWDEHLPRTLRRIASGHLKTIGQLQDAEREARLAPPVQEATRTVGDAELIAELKAAMKGATARPWVAFDSGDASKATLAIMKGRRPKKRADNRFVRWPEIIAWSGFDAADVPHAQRRANLHLIVEIVNALPRIIDALSHTSSCGGI